LRRVGKPLDTDYCVFSILDVPRRRIVRHKTFPLRGFYRLVGPTIGEVRGAILGKYLTRHASAVPLRVVVLPCHGVTMFSISEPAARQCRYGIGAVRTRCQAKARGIALKGVVFRSRKVERSRPRRQRRQPPPAGVFVLRIASCLNWRYCSRRPFPGRSIQHGRQRENQFPWAGRRMDIRRHSRRPLRAVNASPRLVTILREVSTLLRFFDCLVSVTTK
jgi:hypothetical protein